MQKKEDRQQNNRIQFSTHKAYSMSIADQNKFGGARNRSCRFITTPATGAWPFAFTEVLEENLAQLPCGFVILVISSNSWPAIYSPLTALLVWWKTEWKRKGKRLIAWAKAISWSPRLMWQITSQHDTRISEEGYLAGRPFGRSLEANSDCLRWCNRLFSLLHWGKSDKQCQLTLASFW